MRDIFKVVIGTYSYAVGQIGKPIRPDLVREFWTVEAAMRDLWTAIERQEGYVQGEGQSFLIEMPDGRKLPLREVYVETFGVEPVKQDNAADLYPMLFPKGKKARKL
jgi:hypothetical protein